jgi:signal transduction histidine kinase
VTRSIRTSLVSGTIVGVIVVIAVAGAALYQVVRSTLLNRLDEQLGAEARLLSSAVRVAPDGIEVAFDELDVERFAHEGGTAYLEVWSEKDSVLYRSPSLHNQDLRPMSAAPREQSLPWLGGDARVRAVTLTFRPDLDDDDPRPIPLGTNLPRPQLRLTLARSLTDIDALMRRFRRLFAMIGTVTALATGGVLAIVIRRSMSPLDRMADEIASLGGRDLSSRISPAHAPLEITPVIHRLNELLDRQEASLRRELVFSADVAHELRTPLAGLLSTAEVTLARERDASEYRNALHEILEPLHRMQAMVERLLYLGKLESGRVSIEKQAVDVGEVARVSWQSLEEERTRRGLEVRWELNRDAVAFTDPLLLGVAIRNLLENAVAYAAPGGLVRIEAGTQDMSVVFRVTNDGSQVAQEDVAALMDRFTRADRSRTATGVHSGLGLAIVGRIMAVLDGSIVLRSSVGGEFEASLILPTVQHMK